MKSYRIADWERFRHSIHTDMRYGERALRRPSDRVLDAFENRQGWKLPKSYRQYIKVFGAGELFERWRIAAPGNQSWPYWDLDATNGALQLGADQEVYFSESDRSILHRLFFFGELSGQDPIGWALCDKTNVKNHEYRIYVRKLDSLQELASSFRSLIESSYSAFNRADSNSSDDEMGSRLSFWPAARE